MSTEPLYDEWEKQIKAKGYEEGRREGLREMLLPLLCHRFGALPEDVIARVHGADSRQLLRWGRRMVTATTLDEVFRKR